MPDIRDAFETEARHFQLPGVPASGVHGINVTTFRAIGALIEDVMRNRSLLDLVDAPESFGGKRLFGLRVNADEDGIEFYDREVAQYDCQSPDGSVWWRIRLVGPGPHSIAELRFLQHEDDVDFPAAIVDQFTNEGSGSLAVDYDPSTWWPTMADGAYLALAFEERRPIGFVTVTAPNDGSFAEAPDQFYLEYSDTNALDWTVKALFTAEPWTIGATQTFVVP